jgi:hypothetical protein
MLATAQLFSTETDMPVIQQRDVSVSLNSGPAASTARTLKGSQFQMMF